LSVPNLTTAIDLHAAQEAFCHSSALYRGFVGGRGAGKSFIGAYDLIRRAQPGHLYGVYAPSYPMMRDATLRSFLALARRFNYLKDHRRSDNLIVLGNDAEVMFRSLDDPERARGPNISGAWVDEASLVPREAFEIIIAALREGGQQGWLSATFTPKGRTHWTYETFALGNENTALFRAKTSDNPFLPAAFAETIAKQYTTQLAAQELSGEFVDMEGTLAKREWFKVVDALPSDCKFVRAWDFAATERSAKSADPDFLAGVKLGVADGRFYIAHVVHSRCGPGDVEALVRQTAELDGKYVALMLEQEPGSSGKLFTAALVRALAGWPVEPHPASGDKVTRAMPWLAQAQAGNVFVLRGPWLMDLMDEIAAFPVGAHDDQVDAVSGAFAKLTAGNYVSTARGRVFTVRNLGLE
jgi:predicted phage terminase large subunit-like protein